MFDKFLIHCSALGSKSDVQVLSRFRADLWNDLRNELLARGITELNKDYTLSPLLLKARLGTKKNSGAQVLRLEYTRGAGIPRARAMYA